jgi:GNAT superfamily N-acetyltransferase
MALDDIDRLTAMILADDWGDRRTWLEFVATHPACHAAVAVDPNGEAYATAVATVNGSVGWIGTVWVAPDRRRGGIGRALTEAVIDAAERAGCRTLVLVATEAGRPLYERLGFEVQTWYLTMEAPGLAGGAPDPAVRPFRPEDLPAMAALDGRVTGEDRRHLLEAFAAPDGTRVLERAGGGIAGFVVRAPWGGGATIAEDPRDAMAILEARRRIAGPERRVRAGVVLLNGGGLARMRSAGWREAWRAPRLIRGVDLAWRPEGIWGQFNHALG